MLQISVLGPTEVHRDGRLIAVPGGKTTELLVRLALEAGVLVRTDRLVDELWEGSAVTTRRNTLQAKVAKLRRALGDPPVIVSGDGGYQLVIDRSDVDALAVLTHAGTVVRLVEGGDDRAAAELCASALAMFRGDVLQGAGEGAWVDPHRTRLEEARVTLLETGFAARLRLGEVGEVIGELEAALAVFPFQEGLWELLITALYRAGRQADALATYQRVRNHLADELGLDPRPQLQQLEQQILNHDASLEWATRRQPAVELRPRRGNLPTMSAELVGRDDELAALGALLDRSRLVEVVGPGGIGKTAIAIETGRRVEATSGAAPGGVWLARLETAVSADDVMDTVLAALGVTGGEPALFERLRATSAVLILDNCEHVVDAATALAVRLLDASPGLRILCTSQVRFDVDGEALFELAPLGLTHAVELFGLRADPHRMSRVDDQVDGSVLELCEALDGLPLAIELAAARTKTLSIEQITRRLDQRFAVLSDPSSRKPERRRALKSTIQWSYDLLFPDDQRGLWALATFAAGASLAAVEFVLDALEVPAAAAIDVVSRLASRSLVTVDDEGASPTVRYRLLDSIRAYALAAMEEAGLSERAHAAQAEWFALAAAASTAGVRSSAQAEHLAFARLERANIDAALAWTATHDPLEALGIASGFGWAWVVLGDSRGAQRLLTALAAAGDAASAADRAAALLLAGWIEASTDRLERARDHIAAATEIADAIGDVELQARCAYFLAYVVSHHGAFGEAMELTDRSRAVYDTLDRPWDQVANGLFAARAAISAGDGEGGAAALDHVAVWLEQVDDPWMHVRHDAALGELARVQHRFDDAVVHIGRAAATSGRLGFLQTEAYQLASLGRARYQAGDHEGGAATLRVAVDRAEATGDLRMAALARVHLGRMLRALDQVDDARSALEAAAAWHRESGGGEQAALGECLLAAIDATDGSAGSEPRLVDLLDEARLDDHPHVEVFALDALARLAAEEGDAGRALGLVDLADRRMLVASHFISEFDRVDARWIRQAGRLVGPDRTADSAAGIPGAR